MSHCSRCNNFSITWFFIVKIIITACKDGYVYLYSFESGYDNKKDTKEKKIQKKEKIKVKKSKSKTKDKDKTKKDKDKDK